MRLPLCAALAAVLALSGCGKEHSLPDTLMFPPGLDIQYQGQKAKLYGTAKCAQGQLTGNSCLIFHPREPKATGIIVMEQKVHELQLIARQDPHNPIEYIVQDTQGRTLLQTSGRHDEYGNISITPY